MFFSLCWTPPPPLLDNVLKEAVFFLKMNSLTWVDYYVQNISRYISLYTMRKCSPGGQYVSSILCPLDFLYTQFAWYWLCWCFCFCFFFGCCLSWNLCRLLSNMSGIYVYICLLYADFRSIRGICKKCTCRHALPS